MAEAGSRKKDIYAFAIVKKFPKYKSFEILKHPEGGFVSSFVKTFSHLFKGE
jgi:hypothetical protein